jgi:hypothetical protein
MTATQSIGAASSTTRVRRKKTGPLQVAVQTPLAGNGVWSIFPYLTDRWGDLNDGSTKQPPEQEREFQTRLDELRGLMWDEITFVARLNGDLGILFEVEFCSRESEEGVKHHDPSWYATLKTQATVDAALLAGMRKLTERFPSASFAVPEPWVIIHDRPAAWAFVRPGVLTKDEMEDLGRCLLDL